MTLELDSKFLTLENEFDERIIDERIINRSKLLLIRSTRFANFTLTNHMVEAGSKSITTFAYYLNGSQFHVELTSHLMFFCQISMTQHLIRHTQRMKNYQKSFWWSFIMSDKDMGTVDWNDNFDMQSIQLHCKEITISKS